jgi:hypothetical protein
MKLSEKFATTVALLALWGAIRAIPSSADYRAEAAREASKTVKARAAARNSVTADALKVSTVFDIGRFYKVGDHWTVSVRNIARGMVRKTDQTKRPPDRLLDPLFYDFRVVTVASDKAVIEVKQIGANGKPLRAKGRVSHVEITLDRSMRVVGKKYFYPELNAAVPSEFEAFQSLPMGFNSFPIELPDFRQTRALQNVNASEGMLWFESHDIFARSVRVAWKKGDLWPTYVQNPSGISALVSQEMQQ